MTGQPEKDLEVSLIARWSRKCSFGWDLRVDSWSRLRATKDQPTGSFSLPGVSECGINIKRLSKRKTKQKSTYPKRLKWVKWHELCHCFHVLENMFLHEIEFIHICAMLTQQGHIQVSNRDAQPAFRCGIVCKPMYKYVNIKMHQSSAIFPRPLPQKGLRIQKEILFVCPFVHHHCLLLFFFSEYFPPFPSLPLTRYFPTFDIFLLFLLFHWPDIFLLLIFSTFSVLFHPSSPNIFFFSK